MLIRVRFVLSLLLRCRDTHKKRLACSEPKMSAQKGAPLPATHHQVAIKVIMAPMIVRLTFNVTFPATF